MGMIADMSGEIYGSREQARSLWMFLMAHNCKAAQYVRTSAFMGERNITGKGRIALLPSRVDAWILVNCTEARWDWLTEQIKRKYKCREYNYVTLGSKG